jgi:hypothetical protein|tara:strand:+ start:298 stop:480 length:183 start_codon:yes stop_codon:yes gene_type:complete
VRAAASPGAAAEGAEAVILSLMTSDIIRVSPTWAGFRRGWSEAAAISKFIDNLLVPVNNF